MLPPCVAQPGNSNVMLFLEHLGIIFSLDLSGCLNVAFEYCGRKPKYTADSYSHVLLILGFQLSKPMALVQIIGV